MSRRSRAREVALQVLYQDDLNPRHNPADRRSVRARSAAAPTSWSSLPASLVAGVRRNRAGARRAAGADGRQLEPGADGRHRSQRAAAGRLRNPVHRHARPRGHQRGRRAGQALRHRASRPSSSTAFSTGCWPATKSSELRVIAAAMQCRSHWTCRRSSFACTTAASFIASHVPAEPIRWASSTNSSRV